MCSKTSDLVPVPQDVFVSACFGVSVQQCRWCGCFFFVDPGPSSASIRFKTQERRRTWSLVWRRMRMWRSSSCRCRLCRASLLPTLPRLSSLICHRAVCLRRGWVVPWPSSSSRSCGHAPRALSLRCVRVRLPYAALTVTVGSHAATVGFAPVRAAGSQGQWPISDAVRCACRCGCVRCTAHSSCSPGDENLDFSGKCVEEVQLPLVVVVVLLV